MRQNVAFAVVDLQGFIGENSAAEPGKIGRGNQRFTKPLCGEANGIGSIQTEKR